MSDPEVLWTCGAEGSIMDPPIRLVRLAHGEYRVEQFVKEASGVTRWEAVNTAAKYEFMGNAIEDMLKIRALEGENYALRRAAVTNGIFSAVEALDYGTSTPNCTEDGIETALVILEDVLKNA